MVIGNPEDYDLFVNGLVAINFGSEAIELQGVSNHQLREMLESEPSLKRK